MKETKNTFKIFIYLLMCVFASFKSFAINIVYDVQTLDFLYKLSNPILKVANLPPNSLTIYLNASEDINAFVTGGQNMFVNTGLISKADNYDEVAGVVAHEIGHIKNGHLVAMQASLGKQQIPLLVGMLTGVAAAIFSPEAGILLATSSTQIAAGNMLANSRAHENEADLSSLEYIEKSGYSTKGMYNFMGKLYKQQGVKQVGFENAWSLTHPLSYNRMQLFERNLQRNSTPLNSNKELKDAFLLVKAKLNGFALNKTQLQSYYKDNLNSKYYLYALSISEFRHKNFDEGFKAVESALKLDSNIYIKETKASFLLDLQRFDEAEAIYKEILKENQNFYYYYILSYIQYNSSKYEESLNNINTAIKLFRNSPALWNQKVLTQNRLGNKALAELANAEKLLLLGDYIAALNSAERVKRYLDKNSSYYLDANYIIEKSQEKLKK